MPTDLVSEWTECRRVLPYRDYLGHWQIPLRTQYRVVITNGRKHTEYREREETFEEWAEDQL